MKKDNKNIEVSTEVSTVTIENSAGVEVTVAKEAKIKAEHREFLQSYIKGMELFTEKQTSEYITAHQIFLAKKAEIINTLLVSAYDREGVFTDFRREFELKFNLECLFSNKQIFEEIVQLSFDLFGGVKDKKGNRDNIDKELQILERDSGLIIDFNFQKWIEGGRAHDTLIKHIPGIIAKISKILSHNVKEDTEKVYKINKQKVTKTLLKQVVKDSVSPEALENALDASITEYNEAFNVNILFANATKNYDKSFLISFLNEFNEDILKDILAEKLQAKGA